MEPTRGNVETEPVDVDRPNRIVVAAVKSSVGAAGNVPRPQRRVLAARDQVISSGNESEAVNGSAVTSKDAPAVTVAITVNPAR